MLRSRILLVTAILMTCLSSFAEKDGWQVYPAYRYPVQCLEAGNSLYIITSSGELNTASTPYRMTSKGNLVRYDLDDGMVRTYDCLNDLNGQHISLISYNGQTGRLILVYDDYNIDLLDTDDGSITNISSFVGSGVIINSVFNDGEKTYLCTSKGISEVDTESAIIKNTFVFADNVSKMCRCNGYYYIATDASLLRIKVGGNMYNQSERQSVISYKSIDVAQLDNMVYSISFGADGKRTMKIVDTRGESPVVYDTGTGFLRVYGGEDCVLADVGSWIYSFKRGSTGACTYEEAHSWLDVKPENADNIWVVDGNYNILKCKIDDQTRHVVSAGDTVSLDINSPKRDAFYNMHYDDENRLIVAGGVPPYSEFYIPETAMLLQPDGTWTGFDEKTQKAKYPYLSFYNLNSVVEDPEDDGHFYAAVSRNGLEEYRMNDDDVPVFRSLSNNLNSPLRSIMQSSQKMTPQEKAEYCACYGLKFDRNGNLWMAQEMMDTIIRVLRPDRQWLSLYYPETANASHPRDFLFPKSGPYFLINEKDDECGILGFDINGTINYVEDDTHMMRSTITNQRETSYNPKNFYCMTETNDGEIWVGTSEGLFVIADPTEWFSDKFRFYQIIKNRDDGSGLADYVLDGVKVTAIAVDGANRKWIGTDGNGVYLLSDNGLETLHHFTKDDSPLLSNKVYTIAINPQNGLVMIGTDVGLCSYNEGVTKAAEILDEDNVVIYPNPVTPDCSGIVNITNLTEGAEVKILSSSGQVVWGGQSTGGRLVWDCSDMRGHHVDSGVYHVLINTKDAGKTISKRLVVVR